jgi:hypothetical protein
MNGARKLASDPLTPRPPLPQGGEGEKEICLRHSRV